MDSFFFSSLSHSNSPLSGTRYVPGEEAKEEADDDNDGNNDVDDKEDKGQVYCKQG